MQRKFRYLPHTADFKFEAYGKTFEEALQNAASAMLNIMFDIKRIKKENSPEAKLEIKEKARSLEDLVWYVLQDLITKIDEKSLPAYFFSVESFKKTSSSFFVSGFLHYKKSNKDFSALEVKAVTGHDLSVTQKEGKWIIRAVVDV